MAPALQITLVVETTRLSDRHMRSRWIATASFVAGVAVLVSLGACRRGVPVVDMAPKPATARGTIAGIVSGPDGATGIPDRTVTATNLETGERHQARTTPAGGFSIEAVPGKYRLQVELHAGESLIKAPDIVTLDRGDIDSHVEFVVGTVRVSRPRPDYRGDRMLGAPIA